MDVQNIQNKPAAKNIALFIDGTWNVDENNTNVWRLYSLCARQDKDGLRQATYYTRGVGTSFGEKVRGGLFGLGIDGLIKDAYEWLVSNYEKDDRIFIFGFSRGAYAARSLAGLVARYGVLKPGSPIGTGNLFARSLEGYSRRTIYGLADMSRTSPSTASALPVASGKTEAKIFDEWLDRYSQPADIAMVGVWDTVGALRGAAGYRETGLRVPIRHVFHALAIDEHRPTFAPTLLTQTRRRAKGQDEFLPRLRALDKVEQRWFTGAHANVGGGYNDDVLPQLPLKWIKSNAAALGLVFRDDIIVDGYFFEGKVVDSFRTMAHGAYYALHLGRPRFREIGADPVTGVDGEGTESRVETVNETIDAAVFERWRRDPLYRPRNLQAWAAKRGVDIGRLSASVSALDPSRPLGGTPELTTRVPELPL